MRKGKERKWDERQQKRESDGRDKWEERENGMRDNRRGKMMGEIKWMREREERENEMRDNRRERKQDKRMIERER